MKNWINGFVDKGMSEALNGRVLNSLIQPSINSIILPWS
jgi:hypothetical protein